MLGIRALSHAQVGGFVTFRLRSLALAPLNDRSSSGRTWQETDRGWQGAAGPRRAWRA
jgi:hypothetical protein